MKLDFDRSLDLPVSADRAWAFLDEIDKVASCLPGAAITEQVDPTHYRGTVAVRLGPVNMAFQGAIEILTRDAATRTLGLTGKGSDKSGTSVAEMELTASVAPAGDNASTLAGKATVNVSGKVAAMGARLMNSVSEQAHQGILRQSAQEHRGRACADCGTRCGDGFRSGQARTAHRAAIVCSANRGARTAKHQWLRFHLGRHQIVLRRSVHRQAGFPMTVQPASLAELAVCPARLRVSAVVLAAGLSARLGGGKMLLDAGGMPLIRRTVENVLAFGPEETIVVTGHRAREVEGVLAGLPLHCVHNPHHTEGQPTSVASGVRALSAPCNVCNGSSGRSAARHGRPPARTDGYLRRAPRRVDFGAAPQ